MLRGFPRVPTPLIFRPAWSSHMRPLTILFMPESAYGPTNNCIGIGDVLRRRGHRVVFAAEASWQGKLEPLGFTEDLVNLAEPGSAGLAGDVGGAGLAGDPGGARPARGEGRQGETGAVLVDF